MNLTKLKNPLCGWAPLVAIFGFVMTVSAGETTYSVGAAKVDITPTHPVLLAGYGGRTAEHEGVDTPIWARALVIDDGKPAVIVAVENCGVPAPVVEEVAKRLAAKAGIERARFVIASTHTHSAPTLTGYAPVVWDGRATPEQKERVARYTACLTGQIVDVVLQALDARRPAKLAWGQGRVGFGGNRRVLDQGRWVGFGHAEEGPVDHSLPVLVARGAEGKPIAVWAGYACHCTTAGARNCIGGDWAGFASQRVEEAEPGAVALTTIGCGADVGPQPSGNLDLARQHGGTLADEVARLIGGRLQSLNSPLRAELRELALPLAAIPPREHWERAAAQPGFNGYHAQLMLQRLERDGQLPAHVKFPLTTWQFGDQLAMVFLAGEVVVDYAVRLKSELDWTRLWITAWSNDVPCYIPSQRVLNEGGYEADFSMIYYAQPARFDPAVEDVLVGAVKEHLEPTFARADTPDATFLRPPSSRELFAQRLAQAAAAFRCPEHAEILQTVGSLARVSREGFARLTHNDGGQGLWYDYAGRQRNRPYIRQLKQGDTIRWETSPAPDAPGPQEAFVFLGGVGWESEPKTEGFALLVNDEEGLRFDVTRQPGQWHSGDGSVRLLYVPTWTSEADSSGFFYVVVDRSRLRPGGPCALGVRSLGNGSKRWFALDPVTNVKVSEAVLQEALRACSKAGTGSEPRE